MSCALQASIGGKFVLVWPDMSSRAVQLHVAGQNCRVVTSADEQELEQLAAMVEDKLSEISPDGRPVTTQSMLLAAIALAAEVRESNQRLRELEAHAKQTLGGLLERVDSALATSQDLAQEQEGRRKRNSQRGIAKNATSQTPSDH